MIAELVDGIVKCPKCNSPMNITKARRRYVKKNGEPTEWEHNYHWGTQVVVGYCSCGEYVFYHINK